jgi:hypothetical protein
MGEPIRLDSLTQPQLRRVRCLELACALFPSTLWETKIKVAIWLYRGTYDDAE